MRCPCTAVNPQPGAVGSQTPLSSRVCSSHPSPHPRLLGQPSGQWHCHCCPAWTEERPPGPCSGERPPLLDSSHRGTAQTLSARFFRGEKLLLRRSTAAPAQQQVLGGCWVLCLSPGTPSPTPVSSSAGRLQCCALGVKRPQRGRGTARVKLQGSGAAGGGLGGEGAGRRELRSGAAGPDRCGGSGGRSGSGESSGSRAEGSGASSGSGGSGGSGGSSRSGGSPRPGGAERAGLRMEGSRPSPRYGSMESTRWPPAGAEPGERGDTGTGPAQPESNFPRPRGNPGT